MPRASKLPATLVAALTLLSAALPGPAFDTPAEGPPAPVTFNLLRRQASPEEIARWVADLGDERYNLRQKATKALEEVGQPALKALEEATRNPQLEVQRRARQLIERIEVNEATAPTLVRLKLKDAPVTRAVEELTRQSRIKLELVPQQGPGRQQLELKRISLDLERATFWEALEKLCQAAGLSYVPRGTRTLQLELAQAPARPVPTAYSGPFRLRITALHYGRNLNLLASGAPGQAAPALVRNEFLNLSLDLVTEPHINILSVGAPHLQEAQDDAGESLVAEGAAPGGNIYRPGYYGTPTVLQTMSLQTSLRPPTRPAATLKTLKGMLTVEVLAQRKPLLRVDDVMTAKGKIFKGAGNLGLVILQVQDQGNGQNGQIRFILTGLNPAAGDVPPGVVPQPGYGPNMEAYRPAFELTDAEGRPFALNLNLSYNGNPGQENVLEGSFYYSAAQDNGLPARFTFYSLKRVRSNVPFEFQDVPMP